MDRAIQSTTIDYNRYYGKKYFPIEGNLDIIKSTHNCMFDSVLDVSFGRGGASVYFSEHGKKVTALDREIAKFGFPREVFEHHSIETHNVWVEDFEAEPFDAIWASHILEHTANVSTALQKFRSLLKDDGWLFICVPPHKSKIVTGHISMGWSIMQLMFVLYFNGFRVKTGHFASHKYNIAAFVQKVPNPRFAPEDGGIVSFDAIREDFPVDLQFNMEGQLPSINWFDKVDHYPLMLPRHHIDKAISTISELRKEIAVLKEDHILNKKKVISALERTLLNSQNQLANTISSSADFVERPRERNAIDARYYQQIHNQDATFQENNWLVSEIKNILSADPMAIIELGCGNGAFIKAIAPHVDHVTGVDWAKSPLLDPLPDNAAFHQSDLLKDELPSADIVCSADLLEHFEPDEIAPLLAKMKNSAPWQYHVISCYDDGHSHLTIMPPGTWLATFRQLDINFRLTHVGIRRNDPRQIVCTITNIVPSC